MKWNVRDLADMFDVSENTIARWVRAEGFPANNVCGEPRFNVLDVLEWTSARQSPVGERFIRSLEAALGETHSLAEALERGGIVQRVTGADNSAVLHEAIAELVLPDALDRTALAQAMLARKHLGLCLLADGVAGPCPSAPLVVPGAKPALTLYFLQKPLRLDQPRAPPVEAMFLLVSPTVGCHLSLVARLAAAVQDPDFRDLVKRRHAHDHIFRAAHRLQPAASSTLFEHAARSD